jgi:GTP 3',8-cyclase
VADFGRREGLEVRYIKRMNLSSGRFAQVIGGTGGDCARCNRLRLSCDGNVRPCLFSDLEFNVRRLGAERALREAVQAKPHCGNTCATAFNVIGG